MYAPDEKSGLFENAKVGDRLIKPERKPPYIVVDHSLNTKIITKWPGKLYRVEVINPHKERDINKELLEGAHYTRTFGVKILEEIPIGKMFGANGDEIKRIIDITRELNEEAVNQLSEYDVESNRTIVNKAWKNWIKENVESYQHLDDDFYSTLKVTSKDKAYSSPIGEGLSIISSQFSIRTRELVGDEGFHIDKDGEIYLLPKWDKACEALLQAGISYESHNLLSESKKDVLRKPFLEVFN